MPDSVAESLPISAFLKEPLAAPEVQQDVYVRLQPLEPGSAFVQYRGTKVFAVVSGPKELSRDTGYSADVNMSGRLLVRVHMCPFARPDRVHPVQQRAQQQQQQEADMSADESQLADLTRMALNASVRLDQYARSAVQLTATVIEDMGDALPALIMCCSAALLDARILLYDIVVAAVVDVDPTGGELRLFPGKDGGEKKESYSKASATNVCVAMMPSLNQVGLCHVTGRPVSLQHTNDALKLVVAQGCAPLAASIQTAVMQHAHKQLKSDP